MKAHLVEEFGSETLCGRHYRNSQGELTFSVTVIDDWSPHDPNVCKSCIKVLDSMTTPDREAP